MMMTSNKPYLIRAFYEWITDNHLTPHILVDASLPSVRVPRQFVDKDNKIILNIAFTAVQGLRIENDGVEFSARFSGVVARISIPVRAVLAIYTRENGRGMVFDEENEGDEGSVSSSETRMFGSENMDTPSRPPVRGKPTLTVITKKE